MSDREQYRRMIDQLVAACRSGQGQVMATWAREGVWHGLPEDAAEASTLLQGLTREQREVVATMLTENFVSGVHEALAVFSEEAVPPFDAAYEGTPFHDFMGRMVTDWAWPEEG